LRTCSRLAVCVLLIFAATAQDDATNTSLSNKAPSFVRLTPDKIDFGSQPVGVAGEPKRATLTNTGNSRLTISDITVSGIDFTQSNTCTSSLAAGAECIIEVTFKPAINEPRFGTVMISDSDPGSPHMLLLSGTGQ
jgi:hypothetical protein